MLKLWLLDILGVWANPSVYRNFNLGGIDVENRNSMLEPLESNPMLSSITTALLESSMMHSLDHSDDKKAEAPKKDKKKTKKHTSDVSEEDSQSSVSLNTKTKGDDDSE